MPSPYIAGWNAGALAAARRRLMAREVDSHAGEAANAYALRHMYTLSPAQASTMLEIYRDAYLEAADHALLPDGQSVAVAAHETGLPALTEVAR